MAYRSLVATELTSGLIEEGENLIARLDAAGISLTAAFWLRIDGDMTKWRLVLASPEVAELGPLKFYGKVQEHVHALGESELGLTNVSAQPPDAPVVTLIRKAVNTGAGISRIRVTGNAVNGTLIPDALIYRA